MADPEDTIRELRNQVSSLERKFETLTRKTMDAAEERADQFLSRPRIREVGETLKEYGGEAKAKLTEASRKTDRYVRENPWPSVIAAAAVGALVSMLSQRRRP